MHKSDVFLGICLSFLGGIFFASFFIEQYLLITVFLVLIISFALIGLFFKTKTALAGLIGIFFAFGIFCFYDMSSKVEKYPINFFDQQSISFIGKVIKTSDGFGNRKTVIDVTSVNDETRNWGRILLYSDKYSDIKNNSVVKVDGIVKSPENFSNFDYSGYLAKDEISLISVYPKVMILQEGEDDLIKNLKGKISDTIDDYFVTSHSSIVQAMMLGESEKMSNEQKDKLAKSGISHAIAISGSHFVLIASFLFGFLLIVNFWKKTAMVVVIILITFYITLISFPSSGIRAGIMIGCIYLAKILDRNTEQWRILIFAAFFMCLANPLIMKYDLGFQLSFLAVSGLIFLNPMINLFLEKKLFIKNNYLRELGSSTLSAQIFVLPLLFYTSQSFSVFSFFANILIIPVMPVCLILGFIYCLFFWVPMIPLAISFLLFPLISYLLFIAYFFASVPFIRYDFSLLLTLITYLIMIVFIWTRRKKYQF
ncbi:ComEC family competence protein [bacterium]|nr:ComEC family competence protein [bacterium]